MTEHLDDFELICTPISIHYTALHYILQQSRVDPDQSSMTYPKGLVEDGGETVMQLMFDKSPIKMRMYGSPKELAENIKIYSDFPGSHRYFKVELFPYFTTPTIYQSLKNQKFISESDLFVMLQSMIARATGATEDLLTTSVITYFLKSQEKRVRGHIEFVPFDQQVFDVIWTKIKNFPTGYGSILHLEEYKKLLKEIAILNAAGAVEKLKSMIPFDLNEIEQEQVTSLVGAYYEDAKKVTKEVAFLTITYQFVRIKLLIRNLQEVINSSPELFLPHSETKDNKLPITVRMFEDGGHRFVLLPELFNELNIDYGPPFEDDEDVFFLTIRMEDVFEWYGSDLKNIEFIRYPIQRAKHKATPVNGPDSDGYCILAADAFFESLKFFIFDLKIFQMYDYSAWERIGKSFKGLECYFMPDAKGPYFSNTRCLDSVKSNYTKGYGELLYIPVNEIRNAKKDGFTVQNLKNELAHLELIEMFPEIQDHAEVVYAHVDKVKKEKILRTCDLIDAVEYCQLICFLNRFPNFKKFLHSQRSCGRVPGLKCALCDEKKTAPKLEGTEIKAIEFNSQTTAKAVTSSENSNSKTSEVLNTTDSMIESSKINLTELNAKIASLEAQLASQSLSISQESPVVTSSTSLVECIICHIDIINTQNTIKCPNCKIRFHKKCALNYSKDHKKCPSCKGAYQKYAISLN